MTRDEGGLQAHRVEERDEESGVPFADAEPGAKDVAGMLGLPTEGAKALDVVGDVVSDEAEGRARPAAHRGAGVSGEVVGEGADGAGGRRGDGEGDGVGAAVHAGGEAVGEGGLPGLGRERGDTPRRRLGEDRLDEAPDLQEPAGLRPGRRGGAEEEGEDDDAAHGSGGEEEGGPEEEHEEGGEEQQAEEAAEEGAAGLGAEEEEGGEQEGERHRGSGGRSSVAERGGDAGGKPERPRASGAGPGADSGKRAAAPREQGPAPAAVYDRIADLPSLQRALRRVQERRPTVGSDGERAEDLGTADLQRLREELLARTYAPRPLRRIAVPRSGGGERAVFLASARDRVVQTSALYALRPAIERHLLPSAYAYRRGRSHLDAVRALDAFRQRGHGYVYRGDVKDFFETVDRRRLLSFVQRVAGDARVTRLVQAWLADPATGGAGIPAGSVIGPLLSNLYLVPFDRAFAREGLPLVRFGDDLATPARTREDAERAGRLATTAARALGLAMNEEKTHVTSFDTGFRFLGHDFTGDGPRRVEKAPEPEPVSPPVPPAPKVEEAQWPPAPLDLYPWTETPPAPVAPHEPALDHPPPCPVHATPPPPSARCTCTPPAAGSASAGDDTWWLPPRRRARRY